MLVDAIYSLLSRLTNPDQAEIHPDHTGGDKPCCTLLYTARYARHESRSPQYRDACWYRLQDHRGLYA